MAKLEVRSLTVVGGRRVLVRDATFTVDAGDALALIGRSGAGKSSVLRCIAGLDRPAGGDVEVDGHRITGLRGRRLALARRDHMGLVLQSDNLVLTMTALENVQLALDLRGLRHSRARAVSALRRVGLGDQLGSRPHALSGGEAQRVAVARVLATAAPVVLLDEPTAALDVRARDDVADALDALREAGAAVLIVTHDLVLASRSNRIGHLRDGAVAMVAPGASRSALACMVAS